MTYHRHEDFKKVGNEIQKINDFVSIREVKGLDDKKDNMLRFYKYSPQGYMLQLRAYNGICEFGGGKKRNMIASLVIGKDDLEAMLKYAKANPPLF